MTLNRGEKSKDASSSNGEISRITELREASSLNKPTPVQVWAEEDEHELEINIRVNPEAMLLGLKVKVPKAYFELPLSPFARKYLVVETLTEMGEEGKKQSDRT